MVSKIWLFPPGPHIPLVAFVVIPWKEGENPGFFSLSCSTSSEGARDGELGRTRVGISLNSLDLSEESGSLPSIAHGL